jgi:photosystem II stability/assembly factor-like uncharacterized protein
MLKSDNTMEPKKIKAFLVREYYQTWRVMQLINMKSFLIAFFMLTSSFASLRGQWEVINEGYEFRLIDFVSRDIGWMATEDTILKTIDGGETWIPDPWNLGEDFHGCEYIDAIDFVNDSVGWISMDTRPISGSGGTGLFKTIDGGKSWEKRVEGKSLELEYASEDMVIVSTQDDYTHLSKFTDGGITWEDITPAVHKLWGVSSMSFINSDTGIIPVWIQILSLTEPLMAGRPGITGHYPNLKKFQ